jgi:hypothetical protein
MYLITCDIFVFDFQKKLSFKSGIIAYRKMMEDVFFVDVCCKLK